MTRDFPQPAPTSRGAVSPALFRLRRKCRCGQHTVGGAECEECEKKKKVLHRYSDSYEGPSIAPPIVHSVLDSPGQPLDVASRTFFESRFGRDLSHVRVHTGDLAAESAGAVGAHAYTVGNAPFFAESDGQRTETLLAGVVGEELGLNHPALSGTPAFASQSPDEAIDNANSYSAYAQDVTKVWGI